ncbi:MAG: hypothetical protein PWP71_551 [Clostridia bacterium]|jgi:hypothetical protein|nr:hypothetical protein [Clostridia bacterium]
MIKSRKEQVTLEEWGRLYEAAVEFKKNKCWEWMYDTDIFGIQIKYISYNSNPLENTFKQASTASLS